MRTATDRQAFLETIRHDPTDETARLAYADYLDECGDPDGELVRLLCEVQRPADVADCPACRGYRRLWAAGFVDSDSADVCRECGGTGTMTARRKVPCERCDGRGGDVSYDCRDCSGYGYRWVADGHTPAWKRFEAVTGGLDQTIERLSERDRRLFACDCAERVLPLFEREYPGDDRPRRAIETARRYAVGRATEAERIDGVSVLPITMAPDGPSQQAVWSAYCTLSIASTPATRACQRAQRATPDPAAERRWQLGRAVEYRLGFVNLGEDE